MTIGATTTTIADIQSVGEMVTEGYQFIYDGSGDFLEVPLAAQPIAIGIINCDHQVPSGDYCGKTFGVNTIKNTIHIHSCI